MPPSIKDTIKWATALHNGQTDKAGRPYIGHVSRVAQNLVTLFPDATEEEIHAAWLHDVVEDCGVTVAELKARGYSPKIIETVLAVTKRDDGTQSYAQRMDALAKSGLKSAMRVKIADLTDNANPVRLEQLPPEKAASLSKRYTAALAVLQNALKDEA